MSNNTINIVCGCDDRYVMLLAVMLKSLEYNHTSSENINVYVLYKHFTEQDITKTNDSITSDKVKIIWCEVTDDIINNISFSEEFHFTPAYYRLLMPYVLPPEVDRAIYLDCDLLIRDDISKLWNVDIEESVVGAVQDCEAPNFRMAYSPSLVFVNMKYITPIINYHQLGFTGDEKYFNSGVLIINLDKWKELEISQKVIDLTIENKEYIAFNDQYGLNVLLVNEWFQIDDKWNVYYNSPKCDYSYPSIMHFVGAEKPFDSGFIPPYWDFNRYLNKTEWRGMNPIEIACSCDNNHIELLAAMLKSLECNHLSRENVQVFIIHGDISDKNIDKVNASMIPDSKIKLIWCEVTDKLRDNLLLPEDFEFTPHYYKLLTPYIISPYVNRALYLDSDLIIRDDISKLWNIDIEDSVIGAVRDQYQLFIKGAPEPYEEGDMPIKNYKDLGFTGDEQYFNSGVMIMNLDRWRDEEISQKVINTTIKNAEHIKHHDQYALNVILANKWFEIEVNWNVFRWPIVDWPVYIVHFIGPTKPTDDDYDEYYWDFYKYADQTQWKCAK